MGLNYAEITRNYYSALLYSLRRQIRERTLPFPVPEVSKGNKLTSASMDQPNQQVLAERCINQFKYI